MKDDVTRITESRPIYEDGEITAWEQWVYFEPMSGPKTGHMLGVVPHTGDFSTDFDALMNLYEEHELVCVECKEWRNGS